MDQIDLETQFQSVQYREFHAIIGGNAHDVQFVYTLRFQVITQASRLAVSVVKKSAVAVDFGIGTLDKNFVDARRIQRGDKLGTKTFLYAVDRPKHLRQTMQIDHLAGFAPGVIGGKAAMRGRVPVLGSQNQIKMRHQGVGDGDQ